jgi:hypothetical protein
VIGRWLAAYLALALLGCDTPTRSTGIVNERLDPRSEIRARMQAIDSDVTTLGLTPASLALIAPPPPLSVRTCRTGPSSSGPSSSCHDACRLDDSVCDNARHICQLADQIASDGWAAEQCAKAKQACAASHAKCCAC